MAYSNVANGFKTVSADGKLVQAEQTFDEGKGKFQSQINTELQSKVSTLEGKENALETKVNSLEGSTSALKTSVSTLESEVGSKRDKLTAGDNITIENNVISAPSCEVLPEPFYCKDKDWFFMGGEPLNGCNIWSVGNLYFYSDWWSNSFGLYSSFYLRQKKRGFSSLFLFPALLSGRTLVFLQTLL